MPFDPSTHPHRRHNPLTDRWVIVSPQRTQRPWIGQRSAQTAAAPTHDPSCYLCPGNERAGGAHNPDYDSTFVFVNDFAALLPDAPSPTIETADELFGVADAAGECRVLCFSPRHDLTLADMTHAEVVEVIELWQSQLVELQQRYRWVQIFETRGAISGASNPHPHGQIWASNFLPDEAVQEMGRQRNYLEGHGRPMLLDYAEREAQLGERIVTSNDDRVALVPYWAYWPFETLVLPRRPLERLDDVTPSDQCSALFVTLSTQKSYVLEVQQLGARPARYQLQIASPDLCGNRVVEYGEQCDLGAMNGAPLSACGFSCAPVSSAP